MLGRRFGYYRCWNKECGAVQMWRRRLTRTRMLRISGSLNNRAIHGVYNLGSEPSRLPPEVHPAIQSAMTVTTRRTIQYEDFGLEIRSEDGEYRVRVRAPLHGPEGPFHPPFDPDETERVIAALEQTVRGSGPRGARDLKIVNPEEGSHLIAEEVGAALFRSLFVGPVLESFLLRWGQAGAYEGRGLRIRMQFDPSGPELNALGALPWELIYRDQFLSRDVLTPVVRCLDTQSPWPGSPAPTANRLRILVAMASPQGCVPLDLSLERNRIEAAWGGITSVNISFLEHATISAVRRELRDNPFHVLHFMGHGGLDQGSGEGLLLFEDPHSRKDPISGAVLAESCRGNRNLRLVFLNACDTGRLPRRKGEGPFTGVATALVRLGTPAVVAMQFPISDEAAIAFSGTVYSALAAGDPIDAAVAEGRLAIYQSFPKSLEWATPVLFLSSAEGVLQQSTQEVGDGNEPQHFPWWHISLALVLAILALVTVVRNLTDGAVIGNLPGRSGEMAETASPADAQPDLRNVAFSLGASLAMLGQSSEAVGRSAFERELSRLGLESNEERVLFETYQKLEEDRQTERITSAELSEGKEQLRRDIEARLLMLAGSDKVPYMALGHDVSRLYLVLKNWDQLETALASRVAAGDAEAIRASAPKVQLPEATLRELEGFGSLGFGDLDQRAAAMQSLKEILRFFQIEGQGG
jgi:hypothetical protein